MNKYRIQKLMSGNWYTVATLKFNSDNSAYNFCKYIAPKMYGYGEYKAVKKEDYVNFKAI